MAATPELPSKPLSVGAAALPLLTLVACFVVGGFFFELDADMLVLALLAAASVAGIQAVLRGATWLDIQRSTGEKLAAVLPVILILLTIGMLIGTWVLSGTIPALISAGIRILSPRFFVLSAFLVTAVMSLCTGTSWGSAGTLGVALMGAAAAINAPMAATAGAVISGAYLGDKMSPLSDSTNICAIGAGADLYAHIRNMLYTAVPSSLVALLVYSTSAAAPPRAPRSYPSRPRRCSPRCIGSSPSISGRCFPLLVVLAGIALKVAPALALAASSSGGHDPGWLPAGIWRPECSDLGGSWLRPFNGGRPGRRPGLSERVRSSICWRGAVSTRWQAPWL